MSDVIDIKSARTARAEATVNAELNRLSGPMTTDEKMVAGVAQVDVMSLAIVKLDSAMRTLDENCRGAYELIDNLDRRLRAVEDGK